MKFLETVIKLEHVDVSFQGKPVLSDITFSILQESFTGIIGPNGAGKTTLLRLITGLLLPDRGVVTVFGKNPARLPGTDRKIGYVPQKMQFDRRFPVNAMDVVTMGKVIKNGFFTIPGPGDKKLIAETMARVNVLGLRDRPIGELSGGQQQLVFLARALVSKPKLLILDEPTTGLDPSAQNRFYSLVKELRAEMDLTVLVVSHDLAAMTANAEQLICINKTMHMHGSPSEVMERLFSGSLYRCEFDALIGCESREESR